MASSFRNIPFICQWISFYTICERGFQMHLVCAIANSIGCSKQMAWNLNIYCLAPVCNGYGHKQYRLSWVFFVDHRGGIIQRARSDCAIVYMGGLYLRVSVFWKRCKCSADDADPSTSTTVVPIESLGIGDGDGDGMTINALYKIMFRWPPPPTLRLPKPPSVSKIPYVDET
jgi:hypothetical protein